MEKTTPQFSLIIPVLNEKESIQILFDEITAFMQSQNWTFEVIFIDDGSTDGTGGTLQSLSAVDDRVRFFSFRQRRGKSAALARGFQNARAEYIVTLDGDLQDQPREILKLWQAMRTQDADLVSGWKKIRNDPWHKIISSRLFNGLVRLISGIRLHDFNCGLKLYRSETIRQVPLYGELYRFLPALVAWKGFKVIEEPVEHRARKFGRSKFGVTRALGMIIDLLTVIFLMKYEGKPSHLFSGTGLFLLLAGGAINIMFFIKKILGETIAPQYPLMILGATLLVIGTQFVFFGLLSEMIVYLSRRELKTAEPVLPGEAKQ